MHTHYHLAEGELEHRGSIDSCGAAIALFSDIDARGPQRKKPPETLCPTVEHAFQVVDEFNALFAPLATGIVISSGHGCYPVLLLKEPLLIVDDQSRALLETLGRRFHLALHQIACRHGWTGAVEYCDLAKVLRLPGASTGRTHKSRSRL